MKVREVDTTKADRESAMAMFDALHKLYPLSMMTVLDAFARNGQLTVQSYRPYIDTKNLTCWELGQQHEQDLRELTPNVKIGCSYQQMELAVKSGETFDMIVIDTPQGLHQDFLGVKHVEHFDFLKSSLALLNDNGLIVLYVNKHPYDREDLGSHGYDEYAEYDFKTWMAERKWYYGTEVISESRAINTYAAMLAREGYRVRQVVTMPCFSDVEGREPYAFRLALDVQRLPS